MSLEIKLKIEQSWKDFLKKNYQYLHNSEPFDIHKYLEYFGIENMGFALPNSYNDDIIAKYADRFAGARYASTNGGSRILIVCQLSKEEHLVFNYTVAYEENEVIDVLKVVFYSNNSIQDGYRFLMDNEEFEANLLDKASNKVGF